VLLDRNPTTFLRRMQGSGGTCPQLRELPSDVPREWTLAAVPMELQRPEAEPPAEATRREGWSQILNRQDTLAAKVALLARMWNGGKDWPVGEVEKVRPDRCSTAAIWAARLDPAPKKQPTVLEQHLLSSVGPEDPRGEFLRDPETGIPAIHCWNRGEGDYIATFVPQRLPTTDPMTGVILSDHVVWIRTKDQGLWLAPESSDTGLSWGYEGGNGPYTLAVLLDRLLDDIAGQPVQGYRSRPPAGLLRLIENTPQHDSTYSREQLEQARADHQHDNEKDLSASDE
jgi:hypothetical protein